MRSETSIDIQKRTESHQLFRLYEAYLWKSVSRTSANHYKRGLRKIEELIFKNPERFDYQSIFDARTIEDLTRLKAQILNDPEFIEFNYSGHNMFSSALKHYCNFMQSNATISLMEALPDQPEEVLSREEILRLMNHRGSDIVVRKVLEHSGWTCEQNPAHATFLTEDDNVHAYMEGHHLIPLAYQDNFKVSLHVWSNIICLCPVCHRRLHFGLKDDRVRLFRNLFDLRQPRLETAGIDLKREDLTGMIFG